MSKLRFTGTLKEIEYSSPSSKKLKFIPDQECAVVEKGDKGERKFVVLLPVNTSGMEGIAFKYDENVSVEIKPALAWLPAWKVNGHYVFVLETIDEANRDLEIKDAPTSKWFHIVSICEKA